MGKTDYVPVECVNIPKMLFQEKKYSRLSADAKLLYSLLLDRKTVAGLNGWIDPMGTPYVIYPKSEMKMHLNASRYRVDAALEELTACDQMVLVTQPNPGRPCQIYVKDITDKYYESEEEKPMCKMMNEQNDKKEMRMMPCMGIPGMHGVAIMMDPEDMIQMLDVLEDVLGSVEQALAEKKEEMSQETSEQEAEEAVVTDFYAYQDDDYWALSKKQRRLIDMQVRGYIDEDGELDEEAIEADACDLGEELGLILGTIAEEESEIAAAIVEEMGTLWEANKDKQLKTMVKTIGMLYGVSCRYIEDMECCMHEASTIFTTKMLNVLGDTMCSMEKAREKEADKE